MDANRKFETGDGEQALPRRVLVVEDDAVLAMSIEDALVEAGVEQVELTASTEAALEALRRGKPEAIVLDVHLADRDDGWAIAELLRTLGPDRPRIVFSTGAPDAIPEDIAELGVVLAKPYRTEALVALLQEPRRKGILSRLRGALG
ncbi:response regulator [Qipengyuania sp. MTN3-11]|uniref:response regulator n=1 Tax=Qipengyuania sp. MTN3-11 TaxID=3056557 RepID=UPI0036F1F7C9